MSLHAPMAAAFVFALATILPDGCIAAPAAGALFDRYEAGIGTAEWQTVVAGRLLDGPIADLAVVSGSDRGDRRLGIYALDDDAWRARHEGPLPPGVVFADVARIGGRDRLLLYEPGLLAWFDPERGAVRTLAAVTALVPPADGIFHVDVTHDVNGSGRDDLVIPAPGGFTILIQRRDGTFADPVTLGPPLDGRSVFGDGDRRIDPWDRGRIHVTDLGGDGRSEIVFWNEDRFEIHHQDENGLFAAVPDTHATTVEFDSAALGSLVAPEGVRRRRKDQQPAGAMTGSVLYSLRDVNGDGIGDLTVFSLAGGGLWNMRFGHEVHFGARTRGGGTAFAPGPGAALRSRGIPFAVEQRDFDRDGRLDVMVTTIRPGIFKAIGMLFGAIVTGSVSMDLELYRMEDGGYPDSPTAKRSFKSYPGGSGERTRYDAVLVGDVNGDRRADLLLQNGGKELRVYMGTPGPALFEERPVRVEVAVPRDERLTWLTDLDRDGKLDVIMHHASATGPGRVTTLIAR